MEFSENVIAIFDDLAKRFGIIIDWSKDNVLPYLEVLFNKWRTYEIVVNSIYILLLICCIIVLLIMFFLKKKEEKKIRKELSTLEEYNEYYYKFHRVLTYSKKVSPRIEFRDSFAYVLVSVSVISGICFIVSLANFPSLVKAIFIPEILFYEQFLG